MEVRVLSPTQEKPQVSDLGSSFALVDVGRSTVDGCRNGCRRSRKRVRRVPWSARFHPVGTSATDPLRTFPPNLPRLSATGASRTRRHRAVVTRCLDSGVVGCWPTRAAVLRCLCTLGPGERRTLCTQPCPLLRVGPSSGYARSRPPRLDRLPVLRTRARRDIRR